MFCFFFKQKTAYEISSRDWSSDVCSSDLDRVLGAPHIAHPATADPVTQHVATAKRGTWPHQYVPPRNRWRSWRSSNAVFPMPPRTVQFFDAFRQDRVGAPATLAIAPPPPGATPGDEIDTFRDACRRARMPVPGEVADGGTT